MHVGPQSGGVISLKSRLHGRGCELGRDHTPRLGPKVAMIER
jgi:hypothetical protein